MRLRRIHTSLLGVQLAWPSATCAPPRPHRPCAPLRALAAHSRRHGPRTLASMGHARPQPCALASITHTRPQPCALALAHLCCTRAQTGIQGALDRGPLSGPHRSLLKIASTPGELHQVSRRQADKDRKVGLAYMVSRVLTPSSIRFQNPSFHLVADAFASGLPWASWQPLRLHP